jgi:hypothetical protein
MYPYLLTLILVLQIFTYYYLFKLNSCTCAQSLGTTTLANIKYLEYIFLFFIVVSIINLLYVFGVKSPSILFINYAMVYALILLVIHIILIVHTYRLYRNMPESCDCAIQWPRYYLYLTTIIASINVLLFIISFIYGFFRGYKQEVNKSINKTMKSSTKKSKK